MAIDPLFRASSYEPVEKILDELIVRFAAATIRAKAKFHHSLRIGEPVRKASMSSTAS
jgi:hypothetical protein